MTRFDHEPDSGWPPLPPLRDPFICCENDSDCDAPCYAHPWADGDDWGEEDRARRGRGAVRMSRLLLTVGLFFGVLAWGMVAYWWLT